MTIADATGFRPYSPTHAAVVGVVAVGALLLVLPGRRWRGTPAGRRFDQLLAAGTFAVWLVVQTFGFLPGRYEAAKALPLQVCDLTGFIAPLALWTGRRPLRALLYFWGLGLSTQGFFQPDLREGPNDPSFWVFWGGHAVIVAAAVYDLAAKGFRPNWRDYGLAAAALAVYLAVILPFDIATGFNYGYVGNSKPGQPSVVDVLGPWPQRVVVICLLVAAALALLVVPWEIAKRWGHRRGVVQAPGVESAV